MAAHNELGRRGEEAACRYLANRHYHLLERNWRIGHLEVDIIADYYGELVFVEVKTRQSEDFESADKAVDHSKRKHLTAAAHAYQASHKTDQPLRFDIITVVGEHPPFRINHIINAFTIDCVTEERRWHSKD